MTQFTKGQTVVLVRDFDTDIRASAPIDGVTLPEMGKLYTVRDTVVVERFCDDTHLDVLYLEEIVNPEKLYLDAFQIMEQGFDPTRFRAAGVHDVEWVVPPRGYVGGDA